MSTSGFWDNVLEQDENLLWAGRPKPQLHWRNWRLYATAPMAALGMLLAAWFIIVTYGSEGDIWLLILPALLVLIPLRATARQLNTLRATRYALTDRRVLFFLVEGAQTRVKAHPHSAIVAPTVVATEPPSVKFIRYETDTKDYFGFEFIETPERLLTHLERIG